MRHVGNHAAHELALLLALFALLAIRCALVVG